MNRSVGCVVALALALGALAVCAESQVGRSGEPQSDIEQLVGMLQGNRFREADQLAAGLLRDPALDAGSLAICGIATLKAGRIRKAEALFNRTLARAPGSPDAHLGLGRIARIRNDPDLAIMHLRKAGASSGFYDEALRQFWKASLERGVVRDLHDVRALAAERFGRHARPLPGWLTNGLSQIEMAGAPRLFDGGRLEAPIHVELVREESPRSRIRQLLFRLNGTGEYPFDIDSASADFMTVSPLLAEELGLRLTGHSVASGVGEGTAVVRFSVLESVALAGLVFRNVPVMVSDLHSFRGQKKGLIGTGLLKRFNVTIDVRAGVMDLYPLHRPDLLAAHIDRSAVVADVPLHLFDATTVEATLDKAPPALYILDTAAATHLVDRAFFEAHLEASIAPSRIRRAGIQGAQGAQWVNRIDALSIGLGGFVSLGQGVHEFPMQALNEIAGRYAAGLLGNPILWPYRVHMDFRRGRLIVERRPDPEATVSVTEPSPHDPW